VDAKIKINLKIKKLKLIFSAAATS